MERVIFYLKKNFKIFFLKYKPLKASKERWEEQFKTGHWTYLGGLEQMNRYSILIGYYDYFFGQGGNILDLGCGQGILFKRIKNREPKNYIGVDLSKIAIDQASLEHFNKATFVCADIESFEPPQKFDMIIFNESLYYLNKPLNILSRYSGYLSNNGKMIISMWDNKERNNKLWKPIEKIYDIIDAIYLRDLQSEVGWIIKVLKKKNNN